MIDIDKELKIVQAKILSINVKHQKEVNKWRDKLGDLLAEQGMQILRAKGLEFRKQADGNIKITGTRTVLKTFCARVKKLIYKYSNSYDFEYKKIKIFIYPDTLYLHVTSLYTEQEAFKILGIKVVNEDYVKTLMERKQKLIEEIDLEIARVSK